MSCPIPVSFASIHWGSERPNTSNRRHTLIQFAIRQLGQGVFFLRWWDRATEMDAGRIGALTGLGLAVACGAADEPSEEVVIFAASSLMEAFQELEQVYEDRYPHRDVRLSFAGSHVLRTQIEQGAGADLIATADQAHLDALFAGGFLAQPMSFAVNRLAIVVGSEGSDEIQTLEDLLSLERIVLGSPQVPVGRYAQEMLKACGEELAAGILERVVSYEDNARLVRAKVELGEAQAAVVYRSDAEGGRGLRSIPVPGHCAVSPVYGIGRLATSEGKAAEDFLRLLESPTGQEILRARGFGDRP